MDIRFSDKRCLTPRLLDADGRPAHRVEGVLESIAPVTGARTCRFVDAVDYDGHACRYRLSYGTGARAAGGAGATVDAVGNAVDDATGGDARWVSENGASAYRPFSRLVVDRLCTFARDWTPCLHRFPGAPPSRALGRRLRRIAGPYTLAVLDTCVTPDSRLWLRAALRGDGTSGWCVRLRQDDRHVEGWLVLAEAHAVIGEAADAAVAREPTRRARVA